MTEEYREVAQRVARRVRELRRQSGMTVQELAWRCDMERSNLSRIELGTANPTLRTLCRIAEALGVAPGELFR